MSDKEFVDLLRELLGYVGNGTSQSVKMCQDDATNYWCVTVGKRTFYGRTLDVAMLAAKAAQS